MNPKSLTRLGILFIVVGFLISLLELRLNSNEDLYYKVDKAGSVFWIIGGVISLIGYFKARKNRNNTNLPK